MKVLLVEPSKDWSPQIFRALVSLGYTVTIEDSANRGLLTAVGQVYDAVIVGSRPHGQLGTWLISELRKMSDYKSVPIIFWHSSQEEEACITAKNAGASISVSKRMGGAKGLANMTQYLLSMRPKQSA